MSRTSLGLLISIGFCWIVMLVGLALVKTTNETVTVSQSHPNEVVYYLRPSATLEELAYAYQSIEQGLFNHQYYVVYPEKQTPTTGDTTWNQEWVDRYEAIKVLIDRAYKEE